jgi:hypothetical protein
MPSSILSANASASLRIICELTINEWSWITLQHRDALTTFIENTSPVGERIDLQDFVLSAEELNDALEFYINNRMWFEDFKNITISKIITTKIRKALIVVWPSLADN